VANKIQNRFAALTRCLDLEGSPGPFTLTDEVVPIVPVSSCLEQLVLFSGASGAAAIDVVNTPTFEAGVYRITVSYSGLAVLAAARNSDVRIQVGAGVQLLVTILANEVRTETLFFSWEINLPEQWLLTLRADGTGAGNTTTMRATIQPL